ncbi:MAG: glycosyltransferase family 4 protein [Bacteroidota bacterium]
MSILFVLEHYHPYIGGAEKLFQSLAEALAARGHQVSVLTTRFDPHLARKERLNGVQIHRIDCRNRYLFTFLSLRSAIRHTRQSDLVHTTTYNAALPAWLAARLCRRPILVTFHEAWGPLWKRLPFASRLAKTAFYYYEQLLLRLGFDRFIAVSDFTRKALIQQGIAPSRITRIYNGLDYQELKSYTHQPPPTFTYTYFGRLGISKGLDLLLPAAQQFRQQYPDSRLVLILPRQPRAMYHNILQLITDLDLKDYIDLRHELSRDELYTQICQSSCVVIPSYSEGFCFVAAETVGLGVPIISSAQGALPEVVSGTYLEMEDMTKEGLSRTLEKAYRKQWSIIPRRLFELEKAVETYLGLYENL